MRRLSPTPASLALILAFATASAGSSLGCKQPASASEPVRADTQRAAVHVETTKVVQQAMPHYLVLTGSLVANQQSDLAANATGKVLETAVERGSVVAKGAVIVKLDAQGAYLTSSEQAALAAVADQQEKLADQECDRSKKLLASGSISQAEFDRTSSQCSTTKLSVAAAQARVGMANKTINDSNIRAPYAGLIAERYINVGEYVLPSTKVATLLEIDPLRLQLTVPEASVPWVKMDQHVAFNVSAYPDQAFAGTVKYMGPSLRGNSRDLVVEAVVANGDGKLRPGMFVTAHLDLGDVQMTVVPKSALRVDGSLNRVFVVVADTRAAAGGGANTARVIEERLVQLGESKGDLIGIADGVAAGELVVVQPTDTLSDGARVE